MYNGVSAGGFVKFVYMSRLNIGNHWISSVAAMAKMPTFTLQASSLSSVSTEWDPVTNSDEKAVASHQCLLRIKR